jgi:hypothetical protein
LKPRILTLPYAAHGPLLLLQLAAAETVTVVPAMVDSGAARSMFPMQVAQRLGIATSLTQDKTGAVGVEGENFPTWSYPSSLQAQILQVQREPVGASAPWGDQFVLNPAFSDKSAFLLGREDFFAIFRVEFNPGNPLPTFSIS